MKIAFHTLGCKVNFYETKKMEEKFLENGFEIVNEQETADVFVINTCTVTNMAERKSRKMLHRCKKKNPQCFVVAVGCYVDKDAEILQNDRGVDLVLGNKKKPDIVEIVKKHLEKEGSMQAQTHLELVSQENLRGQKKGKLDERTRAFIKVQDGCNQFCSYCIIPYVRGELNSRRISDVVKEVEEIAQGGFKEVVITGIHLSSYGVDFAQRKGFVELEGQPFLELLENISRIQGIERIRLGSLEPRVITQTFLKKLTKIEKICPHFHLSLQSGCDATLARMNRHYTTKDYKEKCILLREFYDNPAITTDVIVGFPGESDEEFELTVDFLKEILLADIHVFKYSVRTGTKAEKMENKVSEKKKDERSSRLILLAKEWSSMYANSFIGKRQEVLFEEFAMMEDESYLVGHTERYVKIMLPKKEAERKHYEENGVYEVIVQRIVKK